MSRVVLGEMWRIHVLPMLHVPVSLRFPAGGELVASIGLTEAEIVSIRRRGLLSSPYHTRGHRMSLAMPKRTRFSTTLYGNIQRDKVLMSAFLLGESLLLWEAMRDSRVPPGGTGLAVDLGVGETGAFPGGMEAGWGAGSERMRCCFGGRTAVVLMLVAEHIFYSGRTIRRLQFIKLDQGIIILTSRYQVDMNWALCILILAIVSPVHPLAYKDLLAVDLPADVFDIEYSYHHNFAGAGTPSGFSLLSGHTGELIQIIDNGETHQLSSFAFSRDEQKLLLGFNDGTADLYLYDQDTKQFYYGNQTYMGEIISKVNSMCFSRSGESAVLGFLKGSVVVWDLDSAQIVRQVDESFVFGVACSQTEEDVFAVGGGSGSTGESLLSLYEVVNETIVEVHRFETQKNELVFGVWLADNEKLYSVGKKDYVSAYELENYEEEKIPLKQNQIYTKVRKNGLSLVTVSNDSVVVVGQESQEFPTYVSTFALSAKSDYLFYVKDTKVGQIASLCDNGYFYDGKGCQECLEGCAICESLDECYACKEGQYLVDNTCLSCSVGCLDCDDADSCKKCDQSSHFVLNEGRCICERGTFLFGDMCVPCIQGCLECQDISTCVSCDESKGFILSDGTCVCPSGTYDDFGSCQPCSQGCLSCENQQYCYTCNEYQHYILENRACVCNYNEHFVHSDTHCVCDKGYFPRNDTCGQCSIGCLECTSEQTCVACRDGFKLLDDGCVCERGDQYIDADEKVCKNCGDAMEFCISCISATLCFGCQPEIHRHPEYDQCVCDDGYYPDEAHVCEACQIEGCLTCLDAETCTKCDAEGHWIIAGDKCQCQDKYVEVEGVCVLCPMGCLTCTKEQICTQCDAANHWVDDGQGGCMCQKGFYVKDESCEKCMVGCLDCISQQQCVNCDAAARFIYDHGKCICQEGSFQKQQQCELCSIHIKHCQTCTSENNCTRCIAPFVLAEGKCGCAEGYFVDGDTCSKCGQGCKTCVNAHKCEECENGYILDHGECKKIGPTLWKYALAIAGVLFLADVIFRCLS